MELKETIDLMNSDNYKERLKAEYLQVKIRYEKLRKMLVKLDAGTLDFTPKCTKALLLEQKRYMSEYMSNVKTSQLENKIKLEIKYNQISKLKK